MSARLESVIALLKIKFSSLSLSDDALRNPRMIEEKIADAVFSSLQQYDQADAFELEQDDEVYESSYQDSEFVPVYEDFGLNREFFSLEYISKVITYVDTHPTHSFATLQTKFRRLEDRSYIRRFHKLDRKLMSDFAVSVVPVDQRIRCLAALELLLIMMQYPEMTHEFDVLTKYADKHLFTKEEGNKASPLLTIFMGYVAALHIREFVKAQQRDDEVLLEFQEANFEDGHVFLEVARYYSTLVEELNFDQLLKSYIDRNPEHLTEFLFYHEVLRRRVDADGKVRQLATMREIIQISPGDGVVLEYAENILSLDEVA
ncbi:uncharacterized protein LOC114828442 [Galendromus occidentalis]|uniref:Uncharacterized protein LOC114828442 n=1 Tax=Galendromus occidentalis TaxID=34638 RepID=A0AAJ7SGT4_9ACAR|nr:uncharacterized protein LOC114828442 [Galendromus occidentalis]